MFRDAAKNVSGSFRVCFRQPKHFVKIHLVWVQAQALKAKMGKARYYRAREVAKLGLC